MFPKKLETSFIIMYRSFPLQNLWKTDYQTGKQREPKIKWFIPQSFKETQFKFEKSPPRREFNAI